MQHVTALSFTRHRLRSAPILDQSKTGCNKEQTKCSIQPKFANRRCIAYRAYVQPKQPRRRKLGIQDGARRSFSFSEERKSLRTHALSLAVLSRLSLAAGRYYNIGGALEFPDWDETKSTFLSVFLRGASVWCCCLTACAGLCAATCINPEIAEAMWSREVRSRRESCHSLLL